MKRISLLIICCFAVSIGIAVISQKPAEPDQLLSDNVQALSKPEEMTFTCTPSGYEFCVVRCPYCWNWLLSTSVPYQKLTNIYGTCPYCWEIICGP